MSEEHPALLSHWLEYLGISDCICDWELRGLGVLYRQSLGNGWVYFCRIADSTSVFAWPVIAVRMTTNADCQRHAELAVAEERVRRALASAEEVHAAERAHHSGVTAHLDQVLAKARDSVSAALAPRGGPGTDGGDPA